MLKAELTVLPCPECGELMMAYDINGTNLSLGKCENCEKEFEVKQIGDGLNQ